VQTQPIVILLDELFDVHPQMIQVVVPVALVTMVPLALGGCVLLHQVREVFRWENGNSLFSESLATA
jgi:hypothetical protein